MSRFFTLLGFVVAAFVAVGVLKSIYGMSQGTSTPQQIPAQINNEFSQIGLSMPVQKQTPIPNQAVPQPPNGALYTPSDSALNAPSGYDAATRR